MKIQSLNILGVVLLLSLNGKCEDTRYAMEPRPWTLPSSALWEFQSLGDCYGKGQHRNFDVSNPVPNYVTSRLEKEGHIWEISTDRGHYADFSKRSAEGGAAEILFTNTSLLVSGVGLLLVDVFEAEQEVSFLAADTCSYYCFQLKRKPLPQPEEGKFLMCPHAANSLNWYVDRVVKLQDLGHEPENGHLNSAIEYVKLNSLTTLELRATGANRTLENIDFSSGQPLKNGQPVLEKQLPVLTPSKSWSEAEVIEYFQRSDRSHANLTRSIEGGKDRVFQVLDQLQNSQAAAEIKQSINESFAQP